MRRSSLAPSIIGVFLLSLFIALTVAQPQPQLLWSDEFDSLNTGTWSFDTGSSWGNGELQTYSKDNVRVEDGSLIITVQKEEENGNFFSGRIHTAGQLEFQYGTVEARIRIPRVANGLWPALWMLGSNFDEVGWPKSGSYTILQAGSSGELQPGLEGNRVGSSLHWEESGEAKYDGRTTETPFDLTADFHNYKMEWTPEMVTTFVNDEEIFSANITAAACPLCDELHQPFFFILNVAVGGAYTGIFEAAEITAPLPAELLIDYIRIYNNGFSAVEGSALSPSASPSATSTDSPTIEPTTLEPSASPSLQVTLEPTTDYTEEPTFVTTEEPSMAQTESPSRKPDYSESGATLAPSTATPTVQDMAPPQPTFSSIQVLEVSGATMTLSGSPALSQSMIQIWKNVTASHLETEIANMIGTSRVQSIVVALTLVSQASRARLLPANPRKPSNKRRLQSLLELTFNATLSLQSNDTEHNASAYIVDSFATQEQRASYTKQLRESDDSFGSVNVESVTADPSTQKLSETSETNDVQPSIAVIVGIAAGGAALIALNTLFIYKWRQRRQALAIDQRVVAAEKNHHPSASSPGQLPLNDGDSFYVVTRRDPPKPSTYDDEASIYASTSSSITIEYDYVTPSNVNATEPSGPSSEMNSTVSSRNTIVSEFEVIVPPGKVGLILNTTRKGVPVVQQIRRGSCLEGEVQTGDRLVCVDGTDVTSMGATLASQMISETQTKPLRKFIFARPIYDEVAEL